MKIELLRLEMRNFKGIRSLNIKFKKITDIFGDNATGKTTVFDAFLWLFFGKDSTDRKDFNIKTLGIDNKAFEKLDHEVTADLLVNGKAVIIRRLYEEDWVNPKGSIERVMAGHKQSFYWNGVPLQLKEFQTKVAEILPETLFKLITNAYYFNSLKWQDRRVTLEKLAGEITPEDVMESAGPKIDPAQRSFWNTLLDTIRDGKKIEEYQREISVKKQNIKKDLEKLPVRIDEATNALPDEQDYDAIEREVAALSSELGGIEENLMSKSKALKASQDKITAKMREVQEHKSRRQTIEFEEKNLVKDRRQAREEKIAEEKRELRSKESELSSFSRERSSLVQRKPDIDKRMKEGRDAWKAINAEKLEFKEGEFCCPTCKQDLPADKAETKKAELTKNFNADKTRRLDANMKTGKALSSELTEITSRLAEIEEQEKAIQTDINDLRKTVTGLEEAHAKLVSSEALEVQRAIASNAEYKQLGDKIAVLEKAVDKQEPEDKGKEQLLARKRAIDAALIEQRELAGTKKQREQGKNRIKDLEAQETELSLSHADLEGIEFAIQGYIRAKMDLLVDRVNGRFKIVKFKLFEEQINGGETPCCETLVKGVPYSDINTAAKINAGLDIINTLAEHYDAYAPVFIDNAESVNTLIPVNAQLIRLVVSKDKKLKIEVPQDELFETA